MIFGERMIEEIRWGRKTETRRKREPRMVPGRTYAVQPGRGESQVTRIRCLELRSERLGDVDEAAAQREGFPDPDAFFEYWAELHGRVNLEQRVSVVRFELAEFIEAETRQRILDGEEPMLLYPVGTPCPLQAGQEIVLVERALSPGESINLLLTREEREALERSRGTDGRNPVDDADLVVSALRKLEHATRERVPVVWIQITRIRRRKRGELNPEYVIHDNGDLYLQAGLPEPEHKTLVSVHHWTPEEEHGMTRSPSLVRNGGRALDAGQILDNPISLKQRQEEAQARRRAEMATADRALSKMSEAIAELEGDPETKKIAGRELTLMRKRKEALERKLERIAA